MYGRVQVGFSMLCKGVMLFYFPILTLGYLVHSGNFLNYPLVQRHFTGSDEFTASGPGESG